MGLWKFCSDMACRRKAEVLKIDAYKETPVGQWRTMIQGELCMCYSYGLLLWVHACTIIFAWGKCKD